MKTMIKNNIATFLLGIVSMLWLYCEGDLQITESGTSSETVVGIIYRQDGSRARSVPVRVRESDYLTDTSGAIGSGYHKDIVADQEGVFKLSDLLGSYRMEAYESGASAVFSYTFDEDKDADAPIKIADTLQSKGSASGVAVANAAVIYIRIRGLEYCKMIHLMQEPNIDFIADTIAPGWHTIHFSTFPPISSPVEKSVFIEPGKTTRIDTVDLR